MTSIRRTTRPGARRKPAPSATASPLSRRPGRRHQLTFPLLADEDHEVAEKYGAWRQKSMYGKTYMGVARVTVLIGPDGKVARRWDDVKVDGHAEEVLEAVRALG